VKVGALTHTSHCPSSSGSPAAPRPAPKPDPTCGAPCVHAAVGVTPPGIPRPRAARGSGATDPRYGTHTTASPFERLNVLAVQNAAALRYQT
jgi:hypothetical protein